MFPEAKRRVDRTRGGRLGGGGYRGTERTSQRVGNNRRCQQNGQTRRRFFPTRCEVHSVPLYPPQVPTSDRDQNGLGAVGVGGDATALARPVGVDEGARIVSAARTCALRSSHAEPKNLGISSVRKSDTRDHFTFPFPHNFVCLYHPAHLWSTQLFSWLLINSASQLTDKLSHCTHSD